MNSQYYIQERKWFDYSLRILDLLPEDNFMLNKFIKSETIKEISIEMVRAGFLSKALKIINYSNEDQIKNKIYHKILIEYINNFSLYGVDKLEYNINLIKNDWLNIDENNRPYNETILCIINYTYD